MPIYEYACSKCGKITDVLQKMTDPAPSKCEACGAEDTLSRVVSRTSFVLKGGGWYSDLYGSTKKDSAPKDSAAKDGATKDGATKGDGASKAAPEAAKPAAASSTSSSASGSAASTTTSTAPKPKAAAE